MIFVLLRWGTPVIDKLGPTGIGALTRVMGFIILCIGVGLMIHGIQTLNLFRK
jgi:multiple antibiotic resistance protein